MRTPFEKKEPGAYLGAIDMKELRARLDTWREERLDAGEPVDELAIATQMNLVAYTLAIETAEGPSSEEEEGEYLTFAFDRDGWAFSPNTGEYMVPERIREGHSIVYLPPKASPQPGRR